MNYKVYLRFYIIFATTVIVIYSCVSERKREEATEVTDKDLAINLRWFDGSFDQTEAEMTIGLTWALSYLGAEIPEGAMKRAIIHRQNKVFSLDLSQVGFQKFALDALSVVINKIKKSEAYQVNGYAEVGRFIMLTLNSSHHYFEIVGIPKTLNEFTKQYPFKGKYVRIVNSTISKVNRLIEISEPANAEQIAYFSTEGTGDFEKGTFKAEEFEVIDYMPNGQFRFGIYDLNGQLKAAANEEVTNAGKTAKCVWCHEITLIPFFKDMPVLPGDSFISEQDFLDIRIAFMSMISDHRDGLSGDVDYTEGQDHAFMEAIYIDFMEPPLERIDRKSVV